MKEFKVRIVGVDCPTCVYSIRRNLSRVKGFRKLDVDVTTGDAVIVFDENVRGLREVYRAIRDAGYDVFKENIEVYADFEPEEVSAIEDRILRLKGVLDVDISSNTGLLRVRINPLETSRSELFKELGKLGISIKDFRKAIRPEGERRKLLMRLVAFILGLSAIVYSMSSMFIAGAEVNIYLLLLTALSVLLLSYSIIIRGYKALLNRTPTMDSLISISSTMSFLFGLALTAEIIPHEHLAHNHVQTSSFFEASAGILGFVSFGRYLEERLRYRALKHLKELEKVTYGKARLVIGGDVKEVDVNEVSVNDVVEVKSGDRVPVDGVVIDGWGYVDESAFTGEAKPVLKKGDLRDYVLAGSILLNGYIKVRATRVKEDTVIAHIAESAKEAQLHKPEIQRVADRVVGLLTWVVIALALITSLMWYLFTRNLSLSLLFAASVLAVTCPCPLGIAIPMVTSVGVLKASMKGILVRRGDVFERVVLADTVIFDKTGTLTFGHPQVRKVTVFNGSEGSLMNYVCSVEKRSEHKIANAIVDYCNGNGFNTELNPTNVEFFPGLGLIGDVDGYNVAVGNVELMKRLGIEVSEEVLKLVDKVGNSGGTPILISLNGTIVGLIEVVDNLREEAREVVESIKKMGVKVGIASGDVEANVTRVAKELNMDFSEAGLRPEDKADLISRMRMNGRKVIFVGDGVNDAIAIGSSFVGVAAGKSTDIAKNAGDVVLVSNNLRGLKQLFNLSHKVRKRSLENLAWAFIYNGLLIPVAAGLLYPHYGIMLKPEWAAFSMVLSDISVILNSLRLTIEDTSK
ncbi:MAG: cation-translocating P-type ATPase [Sulfolobales archaeon]|nr:cation-translocating P-type ATPase [Sulfolobales archaeon]